MSWIRQNVERLGDSALDQAITLPWVRDTLRDAVIQAHRTEDRPICWVESISRSSSPTTAS